MASFEDTVLAKSPIFFFRMDELAGTVMYDTSPNATHGTYDVDAVLGIASPVETDPSSRAVGNSVGSVTIAQAPLSDIRDTFSWLVCAYFDGTTIAHYFTRSGQLGLSGGAFIAIDDTLVRFILPVSGSDYQVDYNLTSPGWYFVAGMRAGSVMSLYVNGYLVDQRSDLPTADIDVNWGTAGYYFGSAQNQNLWVADGTDEAVLFNYALSAADVLEIYEAARNRLPMYLTINARSSLIIDSTPPPVYKPYPLRHNFDTPIVERITRLSGVQQIKDGREERAGRSTKTRRRFQVDTTTPDGATRRQMAGFLWQNLKQPTPFPVYQDTVTLTANATAGDTVIYLNTQYRAFDDGSRLRLGSDSNVELAKIDSHDLTSVTLTASLENDWPKGTRVTPMKLAYLDQELTPLALTSTKENFRVTGTVLIEDTPDAPNHITAHTPTYTYQGIEVFDPLEWGKTDFSDAVEYNVTQQGNAQDSETGIFAVDTSDVNSAQQGIGAAFWLKGRDVISKFYGWYENRAGRLNNIWVPTMQRDFDLISLDPSDFPYPTITVDKSDYKGQYDLDPQRVDIALIGKDHTMNFRRILEIISVTGTQEVLRINSFGLSPWVTNTKFICFLRLCRLDADELELVWHTADLVRVVFKFREVLNES